MREQGEQGAATGPMRHGQGAGRLLQAVFDNATVALFLMDDRQHCIYMNRAAEELTGFTLAEVGGRPLHDVIHHTRPDGSPYPLEECPIDRAFPENNREQGEDVFVRRDGSFYPVAYTASPLREGDDIVGTIIEVRDLTAEKRAAESLRNTQFLLEAAVSAGGIVAWVWDIPANQLTGNTAMARLFALDENEVASGLPLEHFVASIHAADRERVLAAVARAVETGEPYAEDYRVWTADGEIAWVAARGRVEFDEAGRPVRFPGMLVDITEHKRTEARNRFLIHLNEALQPLDDPDEIMAATARLLAEHLATDRCAYAEVEEDEDHFVVTGGYVGGDLAPLVGRFRMADFGEEAYRLMRENLPFVVEDTRDDPRLAPEDAAIYEQTAIRAMILVPLHKAGRFVAGMAVHQGAPRRWSAEEVELVVTVTNRCWEAIERARVRRELRESEDRLRRALEIETVGVIFFDPAGDITRANSAFLRMGGYTQEDIDERRLRWDTLTPPEWMPASRRAIEQLRTTGSTVPYEKEYFRKDGSRWWGLFAAKGLSDREGVEFILDITERKQVERELQELNTQLEARVDERTTQLQEAIRELEAYNYTVSHDLRAPLRGIDGFSEVLEEEYGSALDDAGRKYLSRIRAGAKRMSGLIDDILSLSGLSRRSVHRHEVDLSGVAAAVAEELERLQPGRDVRFEIARGVRAQGDEKLLRIAMDNLLGNAWKFTQGQEPARIEFGVAESGGEPTYYVRDNGAGFSMTYADKLFVPFQRLHPRDEFEGNGIGLATVQRIIHKHGGQIWAEGEPSKGACFYFTLPAG